jgi:predicted MPP superfamily phosphohydrolase
VVGIDDLWSRRAEPSRAFHGIKPDDCTIVLAHNPDTALYTHHLAPGVMLSGHTHGGVVRIPYYGSPIKSILRIGKDYYAGLNRYGNFYIYTNRGLGTFWMRIRINCRPEISRFNLVALAESAHREIPQAQAKRRRRPRHA